jgi:curli biogenesis system outer membrane secretion channel CsgG
MVVRSKILAWATASAIGLSGCVSTSANHAGMYAATVGNAPVTSNPTPYSAALGCLAQYAVANNLASPRIAIGRIEDRTGKEEADGSGRKITQGASHMAMSAFAKSGARLVNRYDTSVSELELKYANNKLITDDVAAQRGQANDYRKIYAGQVQGSDFNLTGGITEVNFNIRSTGGDAAGGEQQATGLKARLGSRVFVMNVAIDLQLNDTVTQEVVDVISYQKQIVGYEVGVGLFDFLNGNVFDLSAGEGGLEPVQLAVRSMVERATVEIMANLYGAPGPEICLRDDPLGGTRTAGLTGGYTPAYNNLRTNNAQTREDPNRWNAARDPDVAPVLRGRY